MINNNSTVNYVKVIRHIQPQGNKFFSIGAWGKKNTNRKNREPEHRKQQQRTKNNINQRNRTTS
ncbi:MAG: hypothetical protein GX638_09520 [Crenarchaeota archaeon]|nr:hypothetical protein [Thermoproteota archaeon]